MRLRSLPLLPLLLGCALAAPLSARGQAPAPPPAQAPQAARELLARGDALRRQGDLDGALAAYQAAQAAGAGAAEVWKRIGWTQRAMRRPASAAESLRRALAADPGDREARDDLEDLERARGLRLSGWLGGDEPGTSRNAANAELWYGGIDRLELKGGYGWTDAAFYQSHKAYAAAYLFTGPATYLMADATVRRYVYPVDPAIQQPNPDSTSYQVVPRGTVELSGPLGQALRGTLGYQVYLPNFAHDTGTRIANHKVYGELAARLGGGFDLGLAVAALRDPDPSRTDILGRPVPGAPAGTTCPAGGALCASATRVSYRVEPLVGGFVGYTAARWSAELRGIPNRDLDASYAFSLLSTVTARPAERLEATFQWTNDHYARTSSFPNRQGNAFWASARYDLLPALSLGGGVKAVSTPSRSGATLLLQGEYRTGIF
jgi:hypothetical protein